MERTRFRNETSSVSGTQADRPRREASRGPRRLGRAIQQKNALPENHVLRPIKSLDGAFECAPMHAARLHLPSGAYTFACKSAYGLAYRSQRETPWDRALSRAFTLRRKLGNDGGIGDYILKPKGMHRRTFSRAMEGIDRAEGVVEAHEILLLERLKRIASR